MFFRTNNILQNDKICADKKFDRCSTTFVETALFMVNADDLSVSLIILLSQYYYHISPPVHRGGGFICTFW